MLDYEGIAALAAVIETQSFQSAAQALFITQSAISQRIKTLEQYYGEPVLIRTPPYKPTTLGLKLLGLHKRVTLLEESFVSDLSLARHHQTISLAINRDSLETWFVGVIDQLKQLNSTITLEIIADDQEKTLSYLQNGMVSACASTTAKALTGCKVEFLGYFNYVLVASPEFKRTHFRETGSVKSNLINAPSIAFDTHDTLHTAYLKHFFHLDDSEIRYHIIPSVAGFRHFALNGYAYALIPEIDIIKELKEKKLVNLFPDKVWRMPVYWHTWSIETSAYKAFNELVMKVARKTLR